MPVTCLKTALRYYGARELEAASLKKKNLVAVDI